MSRHHFFHRTFLFSLIVLLIISALPVRSAHASGGTWTVDKLANTSDFACNPGNCSLNDAFAVANSGDTITFSVSGTITLNGRLDISSKDLVITGPGSSQLTIDAANTNRFFNIYASHVSISGLTLANGYVHDATYGPNQIGAGAIQAWHNGSLTLDDVVFNHNVADCDTSGGCSWITGINGYGGALTVYDHNSLTITNSSFTNNSATAFGGAIAFSPGTSVGDNLSLTNVTFTNNQATDATVGTGGAIDIGNAYSATLSGVVFSGNITGNRGGGMEVSTGTLSINNSTFDANISHGTDLWNSSGGGLRTEGSVTAAITNSTFSNNISDANGAGINLNNSTATIANSTFYGNWAKGLGAQTGFGGGLYENAATVTLLNDTVSANQAASTHGGGLFLGGGSVTFKNNIVANSVGSSDCAKLTFTNWTAYASSLIKTNDPGLTAQACPSVGLTSDPKLGPLAPNGGATQTMALLPGSPALNAGTDSVCSAAPVSSVDQRGQSRPVGAHCDIGAYEYNSSLAHPVQVLVAGAVMGTYPLSPSSGSTQSYASINNGPGQASSTDGANTVASQRVAYTPDGGTTWTSYSELMGLPSTQVSGTYWFPWYNSINLSSQISVGNVGTTSTTVTITIGGNVVDSYSLAASASKRVKYASINDGPVKVESSAGVPIIASERISYTPDAVHYTSYAELMGLPAAELTDTYVFPWYNSVNLSEQISVGNVGTTSTTVTITIGGNVVDTYTLLPNASKRVKYTSLNTGPVVVHSSGGVKIISSERISYTPDAGATYTGYSEMMGLPSARLTDTYYFPWYNSVNHSMQVSAANLGLVDTTVTVTINGVPVDSYTLIPNGSKRVKYTSVNNGPVRVHSSGGVPIIASERTSYTPDAGVTYPSFSEMLGLPGTLLNSTYLFPWYNNVNLNSRFNFAVP